MRHDHTKWLTHFVRDRNPDQDFPGESEEEYNSYVGGELEPDASAFEVLKSIIKLGGITPGYSFRKSQTTIYGGKPVLCATEMPIYSFAKYVESKADSSKVSAYGISFLKTEFFEAGGRPAIYGLSTNDITYTKNTPTCRVLSQDVLPLKEQYRYVAHNPSGTDKWIDWSHEREWRWVVQNPEQDEIFGMNGELCFDQFKALPIFKGKIDGRSFSKCCIIVWTQDEAKEIQELLTGLFLAGSNNYDTPFDKNFIQFSRVIILEDLVKTVEKKQNISAQTIEGLEVSKLLMPIILNPPPSNVDEILTEAFSAMQKTITSAEETFSNMHHSDAGYCGYANVVTYEVTNPIIQHMLEKRMATGPYDGKAVISIKRNISSQNMDFNEKICEAAANTLEQNLGIQFYMESRPD